MEENDDFPASKQMTTVYRFDTEYGADSVEWCPHAPHQNVFVCGNYQLAEGEEGSVQKRLGCILLFSIDTKDGLKLLNVVNTSGILDLKWCPNKINGLALLGAVNSDGIIEIYKLENAKLVLLTDHSFSSNKDVLLLSLDWSTGKHDSDNPLITCSDSEGCIHLLKLSSNELHFQTSWAAHTFQAWITGFYYWDTNFIFSGGDDALFLMFDRRVESASVLKNKEHEAGVTSFHSNKTREHTVVTGGYDQYVRLWDIRNIRRSVNNVKMPGPLWRLKWDPFIQRFLLAACMLGGVHIVDVASNEKMEIVESYYEHKNISYGADWCFLERDEITNFTGAGNVIVGTCSFYDKLLCISKTYCDFEYVK